MKLRYPTLGSKPCNGQLWEAFLKDGVVCVRSPKLNELQ